jgi:diadenosine tetraphosphate (Ap4A) HIT family hydrolase
MSGPPECALCRERLETPVVRESRHWRTFVNRNQDLLGKTIVALRRHEEQVTAVTAEEWAELRDEVRWVTERLRATFRPDHFNYAFLMNADPHVHLHVLPRYVGTRVAAGVEFADPDYPERYRTGGGGETASPAVITAVTAALREAADG